ncbi:glycoside hydrolase family 47 protein [Streptomyces sp. NPDC056723]|uniref:glycoside hydrolase family 47 protein n=1 Tax=Streptomyces sp. NPDC056723 TaxID=3345925 RepID=UPI0036C6930F
MTSTFPFPSPSPSSPGRRSLSRRGVLRGSALLGATAAASGLLGSPLAGAATRPSASPGGRHLPPADRAKAAQVRAEFLHGWNGYKKAAWGHDEVKPVSGTSSEFFVPGRPVALSVIEALDTLYVMELDDELKLSCDYLEKHLDLDIDGDFHVFEAIIRVVGGLLSGYLVTRRPKLLELTREAANRLLPAFTKSPTGIPYTQVNMRTGAVSGNTPPLAEVGTNILEFGVLSQLTGDQKYYRAAKKAYRETMRRISPLGLLGTSLNVETGKWADGTDTAPNPPVDSFYEYLWGGWELFGDRDLLNWYRETTRAILRRQSVTVDGHLWFRQADMNTGKTTGTRASELASFYGGLLAMGGDQPQGEAYYRSWSAVMQRYPVLPEEIDYTDFSATQKGNQLRPEYVNSAFNLFQLNGRREWRDTAWTYFQGMKNLRVDGGYTIASDVTVSPMALGDLTPAYWFAENMKYLYLIFAAAPRYDYRTGYLSTEGKLLRGVR